MISPAGFRGAVTFGIKQIDDYASDTPRTEPEGDIRPLFDLVCTPALKSVTVSEECPRLTPETRPPRRVRELSPTPGGTASALSWPDRQLFLSAWLKISQSDRSIDPM